MKTTAIYRELAREAERHQDWGLAAQYLETAISCYPKAKRGIHELDSLAARDVANMERRLRSFRAMPAA